MTKRILSLVLALMLAMSVLAMPSFAATKPDTGVTPCGGAYCQQCHATNSRTVYSWGPWSKTGVQRPCNVKPYGTDAELQRYGTKETFCNECGTRIRKENVSEKKWECHGYT